MAVAQNSSPVLGHCPFNVKPSAIGIPMIQITIAQVINESGTFLLLGEFHSGAGWITDQPERELPPADADVTHVRIDIVDHPAHQNNSLLGPATTSEYPNFHCPSAVWGPENETSSGPLHIDLELVNSKKQRNPLASFLPNGLSRDQKSVGLRSVQFQLNLGHHSLLSF